MASCTQLSLDLFLKDAPVDEEVPNLEELPLIWDESWMESVSDEDGMTDIGHSRRTPRKAKLIVHDIFKEDELKDGIPQVNMFSDSIIQKLPQLRRKRHKLRRNRQAKKVAFLEKTVAPNLRKNGLRHQSEIMRPPVVIDITSDDGPSLKKKKKKRAPKKQTLLADMPTLQPEEPTVDDGDKNGFLQDHQPPHSNESPSSPKVKPSVRNYSPPILSPEVTICPPSFAGKSGECHNKKLKKENQIRDVDIGHHHGRLSEMEQYFQNQTQKILLERYYISELPGNRLVDPSSSFPSVKCTNCDKIFTNENKTDVYGHLHNHYLDSSKRVAVVTWCRYCLDCIVPTQLKAHEQTAHYMVHGNRFSCLICEKRFSNEFELSMHMWENHCRFDMPYVCGLCGYRSSMKFQVVDHFDQFHKTNPHILCPLCLKILPVGSKDKENLNNIVSHIQLHLDIKGHRCSHCALVFTCAEDLNQHNRSGAHTVKLWCQDKRDIIPYKNLFNVRQLRIPKPPNFSSSDFEEKYLVKKRIFSKVHIVRGTTWKFHIYGLSLPCLECEVELDAAGHFPGRMSCSKCSYHTCCQSAMTEHYERNHRGSSGCSNGKTVQSMSIFLKPTTMLDKYYDCDCGFETINPNRLARHLALCGKTKTSSPSPTWPLARPSE